MWVRNLDMLSGHTWSRVFHRLIWCVRQGYRCLRRKTGFWAHWHGHCQDFIFLRTNSQRVPSAPGYVDLSLGQLKYGTWSHLSQSASKMKSMNFCYLVSVTSYHVYLILSVRSKLLTPSHMQRERTARRHDPRRSPLLHMTWHLSCWPSLISVIIRLRLSLRLGVWMTLGKEFILGKSFSFEKLYGIYWLCLLPAFLSSFKISGEKKSWFLATQKKFTENTISLKAMKSAKAVFC